MSGKDGGLPTGWEIANIEKTSIKVGSGATPKGGEKSYESSGVPLIRSMNVHFDGIHEKGLAFLNDEQAKGLAGATVAEGDVLLNITGASIGRVSQVPRELDDARVNQHVCIIRLLEGLNPSYLRYYLSSQAVQSHIIATEAGATRQALTKRQILDFEIPWAPFEEQRRIVAKIEALQERSRKAREALSEVGPLLEQFRQSLLAAAFRGDLTADWRAENPDVERASELLARIRQERRERWEQAELAKYEAKGKKPPKGWKEKYKEPEFFTPDFVERDGDSFTSSALVPIDFAVREIQQGWSPKCKNKPSPSEDIWAVIKTSAVMPMAYLEYENKWLPETLSPRPELEVKPGDVLITRAGPRKRAAVTCMVHDTRAKLMVCDKVYRIRCNENVAIPAYIEIVLNAPQCVDALDRMKTGISDSGVNLTQSKFLELTIPIPSLEEQAAVVALVSQAFESVKEIETGLESKEELLSQLDQSTLAKAFRGELVPQDPNDEPASVLLDRIREQRKVAGTKGKKPARRKKGVPAESAEPLATETPNVSSYTLVLLKAWGKAVPFPVLEAGLRLMLEPNLQQTIVKTRRGRKKAQAESVPLVHGMDQVYASLTSQGAIGLVGKQAYQLNEESETVQLLLDESLLPLAHNAIAAFETLMQRKKLDEEEAGIAISQMVSQPYAATTHV